MQAAEAGDAEAQNDVGEIYERGMGDVPNYAAAAIWYQKAADQKYSRALFNLGTLYEAGLGVDQDQLKALNLYRQAWGLPADSVMFESAARREQEALRAELTQAVSQKDLQLQLLAQQPQLQVLLGHGLRQFGTQGFPLPTDRKDPRPDFNYLPTSE